MVDGDVDVETSNVGLSKTNEKLGDPAANDHELVAVLTKDVSDFYQDR